MIKLVVAGVLTCGIMMLITACEDQIENTRKHNIYYNTATVVNVGQCRDSKCSYSYKTSTGDIKFGLSSTPLSTGQLVYQQCWTEKVKGNQCYTDYSVSNGE